MVTRRSYNSVAADFRRDFIRKGLLFEETLDYLGEHGFSIVSKRIRSASEIDFARREMLSPFAPVHIVSLKFKADDKFTHLVVMTGKGKLICPAGQTDKTIRRAYAVFQTAGLYQYRQCLT